MTYQESIKKLQENQGLVGSIYKMSETEIVSVTAVFPNEVSKGEWEVYGRLLPKGFPADDNIHIIDNIENFKGYEKLN